MATLSTNPRAGRATQTYGVTGQPADVVRRVVEFFQAHGVPAKMRVVPDGFTSEQADVLAGLGPQHVGFHTTLWSSLPSTVESTAPADIREVSTPEEMDAQAILHWRDDLAYLESAGTLAPYRHRGLQRALIGRRIADATTLGCRYIIGGADFESESRTNQMAGGLAVAYTAALWIQRPERPAID